MSSKKAAIRQAVQAVVPVADSANWSALLASFTDSKGRQS